MIKDISTAKRALELMEEAHKLLMESVKIAKENCPTDEFKLYQSAMAQVLGRLFFLSMEPIYHLHPSMAPPDTPKEFIEDWNKKQI